MPSLDILIKNVMFVTFLLDEHTWCFVVEGPRVLPGKIQQVQPDCLKEKVNKIQIKIQIQTTDWYKVVWFCHQSWCWNHGADDQDNANDNGDSDIANDIISRGTWQRLGPIMRSAVTSCQPTTYCTT